MAGAGNFHRLLLKIMFSKEMRISWVILRIRSVEDLMLNYFGEHFSVIYFLCVIVEHVPKKYEACTQRVQHPVMVL